MKLIGLITTAVLSLTIGALTIGAAVPVYAQQEQHEQEEQKARPAQEEKKAQPEKSAKQEAPKATQQKEKKAQPEKSARQEKPSAQQQKNANNAKQEHVAQQKKSQPAQHAGGGRIPADRYKAHFGREHTFRVSQSDYRNHRFQYGGYWFGFNDAWPSNWLYTQDVFVVEIDGVYYLCNASYPGVNVSLNITM